MPGKRYRSSSNVNPSAGTLTKRRRKYKKKEDYPGDELMSPYVGSIIGLRPGFPKMLKFCHKYVTQRDMNSTGGVGGTYHFSCNSLFDPDVSGVGHQPMHVDQIAGIYNHWYVVKSKIKWTVVPKGTAVQAPYRIQFYLDDDAGVGLTPDHIAEQATAQTVVCAGGVNPSKETVYQYYDAQKTWGKNLLANSRQRGTGATVGPSEQLNFCAHINSLDLASTIDVHMLVEIEYTAIWLEYDEAPQS